MNNSKAHATNSFGMEVRESVGPDSIEFYEILLKDIIETYNITTPDFKKLVNRTREELFQKRNTLPYMKKVVPTEDATTKVSSGMHKKPCSITEKTLPNARIHTNVTVRNMKQIIPTAPRMTPVHESQYFEIPGRYVDFTGVKAK